VYRAAAREVRLVVTASDAQGAPAELSAGDLQISEDGRPVSALTGFYRTAGRPLEVALLVDVSTSMDKRLAAEVEAARVFLAGALGPADRARVVPFAEQVKVVEVRHVSELEPALATARGHGAVTRLFDAIVVAAERFGPENGDARRVMVLLSDGEDTGSAADLAGALEAAHRAGAALYTIGVGGDARGREVLRALAERSGGMYFELRTPKELERALAQVGRELGTEYVVTFRPEVAPDGRFHTVRATTSRPGVRLRTRAGYFAMK
jgi:VWFA-related protein